MRKWLPYVCIGIVSSVIIFFKFNQIPIHIAPDEVAFVRLALHLEHNPYTLYSPLETGHATLYFYLLLFSFKLFGITLFALRFPAALFGVGSALLLYTIFQMTWKKLQFTYLPLLVCFIFITNRWYITFARFSFEATFLLFLELTSLLFIFKYVESKKAIFLILSGIFAGLAFHSYTPGRIFFLVPLVSFWLLPAMPYGKAWQAGAQNLPTQEKLRRIMLYILPLVLIMLPLVIQISRVGDYRVKNELVLADRTINVSTKIAYIGQNVASNITMLFYKGDMNGRHNYPGKPALNPILGLFFIAGLFIFLKNKKKTIYDHAFFIYFIFSLLPTLFTHPNGNPNMLRTYTMLPSIMYFVGQGISVIARSIATWQSRIGLYVRWLANQNGKKTENVIAIIIIILVLFSSIYELRTYFIYQAQVSFYAFEVKKPFEWVKARNFQLVDDWYKP